METSLRNQGNICKLNNDFSIILLAGVLVKDACLVERSIKWVKVRSVIKDQKGSSTVLSGNVDNLLHYSTNSFELIV